MSPVANISKLFLGILALYSLQRVSAKPDKSKDNDLCTCTELTWPALRTVEIMPLQKGRGNNTCSNLCKKVEWPKLRTRGITLWHPYVHANNEDRREYTKSIIQKVLQDFILDLHDRVTPNHNMGLRSRRPKKQRPYRKPRTTTEYPSLSESSEERKPPPKGNYYKTRSTTPIFDIPREESEYRKPRSTTPITIGSSEENDYGPKGNYRPYRKPRTTTRKPRLPESSEEIDPPPKANKRPNRKPRTTTRVPFIFESSEMENMPFKFYLPCTSTICRLKCISEFNYTKGSCKSDNWCECS